MISSKLLKLRIEFMRIFAHMYRAVVGYPFKNLVIVTDSIFVGGQFRYSKVKKLKDWGVTGIISMRLRYPKQFDTDKQIDFLNLPTEDTTAPLLTDLYKGIKFINDHLSSGGKVYIHCRMGEGRGPTMAAAYFISEGMSVNDAINTLAKIRSFLKITKAQRDRLDELYKSFNP